MKIDITLEWWRSDDCGEPAEEHVDELIEHGMARAAAMIQETYIAGELLCSLGSEDGEVDYRGSWSIVREPKS